MAALVAAHQAAVPFENLALHAGEPASVDPVVTVAKIVTRHRGGICYELNSAIGWLLQRLGWSVAWHAGRVRGSDEEYGLPLGHLALVVSASAGGRWLVDVGFGGDAICGPVERLVTGLDGPEVEAMVRDLDGVPPNTWVAWETQNSGVAASAESIVAAAGPAAHELPVDTDHHSRQLVINHPEVEEFILEGVQSCA